MTSISTTDYIKNIFQRGGYSFINNSNSIIMAKVEWSAGIDSVSGALSKPSKSGQHSCSKMLLGTHRIAETTSNKCTRLYIRKADTYVRSGEPSQDELAAREKFAAVSRAVATRMNNLTQKAQDLVAFKAQKDEPGGKKTMKSYLWSLEKATYEQTNP